MTTLAQTAFSAEPPEALRATLPSAPREVTLGPSTYSASDGQAELEDVIRRVCLRIGWTEDKVEVGRTLALTSAIPGEGTSSVAIALAVRTACDQDGKVLLVECDLSKSYLRQELGLTDAPGLGEVLSGRVDPLVAAQATRIPNLYVIPGGKLHGNAARLIRSTMMGEFLEEARQRFQFVLLDLPAVLTGTDATLLARLAESTIVVVRSGSTDRRDVQRALRDLSSAKLGGFVLNTRRQRVPGLLRGLVDR